MRSVLSRGAVSLLLLCAASPAGAQATAASPPRAQAAPASPARNQAAPASIAEVQSSFAQPPDDSRILMRWWWFGPSVTRAQIDSELRRMKEGGIGGFELAVVYPMAVDDPVRGIKNERYLSPEFLAHVGFTARKARELGLRMDVTIGSGWSYGGPYITGELQAARLRSDRREISPAVERLARPAPFEGDRLIAAFVGRGSLQEVDPTTFRELDLGGDGPIPLPKGEGPRVVVLYYASRSGQIVKRAALGAEGYALDHFSRAAIETHLREAGDKLLGAVPPGSVYSVFCDSLEVYNADWTGDALAEFQRRRGYDLRPLLPHLEFEDARNRERALAVRRDYGQTLTELYEERFVQPMREWAKRHGVLLRIQNYGEPPAAIQSSRGVDLIDGEGFEFRTLTSSRWAASASHLFGKPVTTSETWTWLHSPAFRATPLDVKAEADMHFLSGINQLIGHGWPYSPPEAGQPGWPFYAAAVLSDKNPWWPVMPDVALYLQRLSFLLRQGQPVAEVGLYAPNQDVWSGLRYVQNPNLNLFRRMVEWIGPKLVPAILDAGHDFELFDDGTLAEARARGYKAIVLPGVRFMPDATRRWLQDYARAGGTLLAVKRKPDGEWPGLEVVSEEALLGRLNAAVPSDVAAAPADPALGFVHRRLADADVYYLANASNQAKSLRVRFRDQTPNAESWDTRTGGVERLAPTGDSLALDFPPYGSRVVVFRKQPGAAPAAAARAVAASEELRSGWSVTFGPAAGAQATGAAVELPHSWDQDAATRYFSGTASYRRTLSRPPQARTPGSRVVLDLGEAAPVTRGELPGGTMRGNSFAALVAAPVREAATVFVNGRRAGSLWAPPYRLDVTTLLRDGPNELRIDVYNTAINQLAEGGRLVDMKPVVERYGQRTRLQDLDELRTLPSGLLAAPRLVVER